MPAVVRMDIMVQMTMMTVITLSGRSFLQLARRALPSTPVLILSRATSLATPYFFPRDFGSHGNV